MIGQRLRELRKANGLTQEQLAGYLKSAKSTISQYENNINEPDLETLVKLADRFGVTVDHLIGRDLYDAPQAHSPDAILLRERLTADEEAYLKESLEAYRKKRTAGDSRERVRKQSEDAE